MDNQLLKLLRTLDGALETDRFIEISGEVVEQLSELDEAFDAVEPLLRFMETHEDVDYGMPGPLVHFTERFFRCGYEQCLIESLHRRPTMYTVWMLNRIINGVPEAERQPLIDELVRISTDDQQTDQVRSLAKEFLAFHDR